MDDTELNKRTRRFFFDDDGYWTAWTTTTTTLASQWGLLINIDSATGDIAIHEVEHLWKMKNMDFMLDAYNVSS
jgi:hypothetical protein